MSATGHGVRNGATPGRDARTAVEVTVVVIADSARGPRAPVGRIADAVAASVRVPALLAAGSTLLAPVEVRLSGARRVPLADPTRWHEDVRTHDAASP